MKPGFASLVLAAAAALALQAGLAIHSLRQESATFDEGTHLPSGYSYLVTGDHRLNPEHPPLVKLLAAAPLLLLERAAEDGRRGVEDPVDRHPNELAHRLVAESLAPVVRALVRPVRAAAP